MRILYATLAVSFAVASVSRAVAQDTDLPSMDDNLAVSVTQKSNLPRNSYLNKRVNSTAELVHQVQTDRVVMDRYCRHFAMTPDELVTYLTSLRVSQLSKDEVFTVYGVPHTSGDFHAHLRLLKKGEPVFIEDDGTPVLQVVCGNPLILGPKKPVVANPVVAHTGPPNGLTDISVDAKPAPSVGVPTAETPKVGEPIAARFPTPGKSPTNIIPLLLGLAGSVGFAPHGHSAPVPEPVSALVLASGLAYLMVRRKRRQA